MNEGSLLTVGITKGKNIISFCNAAHTKHRDRLTLPISYDDGKSWKNPYEIDKSADGSEGDNTGYSDIVRLSRKKIGVLYKEGNLQ